MPRQDGTVAADGMAAALTGPGPDALRRALRGPPGRVALRLPAPALPAHRRVAVALMEEAGRPRGGAVLETFDGELLLTEADPAEATRLVTLLSGLLRTEPERLALPEAVTPLLALPGLTPAATAAALPPPATGIEAMADAVLPTALLRRQGVLHLAAGQPRRLAFLQLLLPDAALAPHLGAAAADADLLRHAGDRLRSRILAELAEPARRDALLGAILGVPLLIDLPVARLPDLPAAAPEEDAAVLPALIATLSAAEAMADGLARRRPALRRAGWGLAVRGLDAATLALLAPDALPADLLLLRWSPDLAGRAAVATLRRVDPARLVLTGCDGAAIEWGMAMGVARFSGPAIDALLAAQRMAACGCAIACACTRGACAARAQATEPAGRAGCGALPLLSALLPPDGMA